MKFQPRYPFADRIFIGFLAASRKISGVVKNTVSDYIGRLTNFAIASDFLQLHARLFHYTVIPCRSIDSASKLFLGRVYSSRGEGNRRDACHATFPHGVEINVSVPNNMSGGQGVFRRKPYFLSVTFTETISSASYHFPTSYHSDSRRACFLISLIDCQLLSTYL